jgi:hypothetical protein
VQDSGATGSAVDDCPNLKHQHTGRVHKNATDKALRVACFGKAHTGRQCKRNNGWGEKFHDVSP